MDWLSLPVNVIVTAEHMRIPKNVRATWVVLLGQSALRESGGVLKGAAEWSSRDWDRVGDTSRHEVDRLVDHGLAHWNGLDLVLEHYPVKPEQVLLRKRDGGHEGGIQSGRSRKSKGKTSSTPSQGSLEGVLPTSALNGECSVGEESVGECSAEETTLSPHSELRCSWQAWFFERYGDEYAWTGRDGKDASELLKLAGDRGPAEVMRRAQILGAQKREKAVTLGIVRIAWNEISARAPAPKLAVVEVDPLVEAARREEREKQERADRAWRDRSGAKEPA